jgi:hypothetical protein
MIRCSSFGLHFPSTYGTGADVRRSPRTDATFSDAYSMVPPHRLLDLQCHEYCLDGDEEVVPDVEKHRPALALHGLSLRWTGTDWEVARVRPARGSDLLR